MTIYIYVIFISQIILMDFLRLGTTGKKKTYDMSIDYKWQVRQEGDTISTHYGPVIRIIPSWPNHS